MINKKKLIFAVGTFFVIISSVGFFDINYLTNQLSSWNRKIEAYNWNFIQNVRNEDNAQEFRNVRTIVYEINKSSDKIEKLNQAQEDSLINAIIVKYRSIYNESIPSELMKKWEKLTLKELEDLNNQYSEIFRKKQNEIVDTKNDLENTVNFRIIIYAISNVCGLILIFVSDMMKNENHKPKETKIEISKKELKSRLKDKVKYHLKLSQIFASIFVGFGIMGFSCISACQSNSTNSVNFMIDFYNKQTNYTIFDVNLINSNLKSISSFCYMGYVLIGIFFFFFILTFYYYDKARSLQREFDNLDVL
jgi:hypothetical protein